MMFFVISNLKSLAPGLRWLIQLRWLALAGQCLLFLAGAVLLHIALPLGIVLPCVVVIATSNLLASWKGNRISEPVCCALLLVLDALTLSILLYWLGGAHNPFTVFYLLLITIATVLLPAFWTWGFVGLCGFCYALLFLSPHEVQSGKGISCCGGMDFHLQGMLLALVLAGMCIAFFVGKLKSTLSRREAELQTAQLQAAKNEKFASLATLAAGVAHELATPLSTIAILSSDLENQHAFREDAKLIRSEVERCRHILEKLGENTTDKIGENPQSLSTGEIPQLLKQFLSGTNYQRLKIDGELPDAVLFVPVSTLLQALAVLVKNACEADESGQPVHLRITIQNGALSASVRDHGPGMTAEVSERAGEPFFTTKEPGKGMGLGLFLVRMFTERMKGSLKIKSTPSEGTIATVEFPITK